MNNHRHLCLRGENSTVHLPSVHIHALLYMTSAVLLAELMSSKAFHSSKPWSILYRIKCSPKSQETGGTAHPRVKRHQEPNAFLHNDEVEIFTVVVVENNVNPHWEDVGSHQSHQVSFIVMIWCFWHFGSASLDSENAVLLFKNKLHTTLGR